MLPELADAVLWADGPVRTPAGLPLPRAADGRLVLAVDVSNWLRPGAVTSPERLFCHVCGRGKGVPGLLWYLLSASAVALGESRSPAPPWETALVYALQGACFRAAVRYRQRVARRHHDQYRRHGSGHLAQPVQPAPRPCG